MSVLEILKESCRAAGLPTSGGGCPVRTPTASHPDDLFVFPDQSYIARSEFSEGDGDDFYVLFVDTPEFEDFCLGACRTFQKLRFVA